MILNLSILLDYYKRVFIAVEKLYPEKLTNENIMEYNFEINYTHPAWVKAHFPLMLIYYRKKAGKLRDSKSLKVMFQNNQNVATQVIWTADDFGIHYRKNKSKGFKNIVAAITADENDFEGIWNDRQPLKKYKNFIEFWQIYNPSSIEIRALCEVLEENYPCDSHGQLRML